MKFKEALAELREKYGDSAALTYTVVIHEGKEQVSVYAIGNNRCGFDHNYRGAIDELDRIVSGAALKDEAPGEEMEDAK